MDSRQGICVLAFLLVSVHAGLGQEVSGGPTADDVNIACAADPKAPAAEVATDANPDSAAAEAATKTSRGAVAREIGRQSAISIPFIMAAAVAGDVLDQATTRGISKVDIGRSVRTVTHPVFLQAMGGAIAGGIVGDLAGLALAGCTGPFAPLVRAATSCVGATFGAHAAARATPDWGRVAFLTGVSIAASIPLAPLGPVGAFVAGFVVSTAADKLYTAVFGPSEQQQSLPGGPLDRDGAPTPRTKLASSGALAADAEISLLSVRSGTIVGH